MSASDYHIYEKLGKTRSEAMRMYLDIAGPPWNMEYPQMSF